MLNIYNSLTSKTEVFVPIVPGHVKMYVCGMTVYDYCHIGHARVMVVFDVVASYLRYLNYQVDYVRNITDIDDKIIARANQAGEDYSALTTRFIRAMHEDASGLGVSRPNLEPKATDYIPQIVTMIKQLVANGYAYAARNGDVFYDVSKFDGYGQLSGRKLEDLQAGARVEVDEAKDDPLDFVLWKHAKFGEPAWASPWGEGRPGWHIECSAMATQCLGHRLDIHGGGMDLKFPHHENEIAQSEATTGEHFVNTWMHVGFVQVGGEKMAKSLGNFSTIRDVAAHYPWEVIRCYLLGSHYRSPLIYGDELLQSAQQSLRRLYGALRGLPTLVERVEQQHAGLAEFEARFREAMDDDFNTPKALAVLFELAREINRRRDAGDVQAAAGLAAGLRRLGAVVGLLQQDAEVFAREGRGQETSLSAAEVDDLLAQRTAARKRKDFAASDRIRDELAAQGVILEDSASGTTWRRG